MCIAYRDSVSLVEETLRLSKELTEALGLSLEDCRRVRGVWERLGEEERSRLVEEVADKLLGVENIRMRIMNVGLDRGFLREHIRSIMENFLVTLPGEPLGMHVLRGTANAIVHGLCAEDLSVMTAILFSLLSRYVEDGETAGSLAKIAAWCSTLINSDYMVIKEYVMMKASGVSRAAMENLVRAYMGEIVEELGALHGGRPKG